VNVRNTRVNFQKRVTSMSCEPEPSIWSRDTGQRIPCLDRCQLIITWMSNIREFHGKPRLHVSVILLGYLCTRVFETRTATGRELFSSHNLIQIAKYLFFIRDDRCKYLGENTVLACEISSDCRSRRCMPNLFRLPSASQNRVCLSSPILFGVLRDPDTVYTDAVSFVTALVSMRLHLSFILRRSSSLSEPGRFENAFKSGAFSKRHGFIGLVNGETASI